VYLPSEYLLGTKGGIDLADYLQGIRDEIASYFGDLEDIAAGSRSSNTIQTKPEVLIQYEQCKSMAIPLVSGGLMDQPYIWLMEWAICQQEEQMYYAILEANRRSSSQTSDDKRDLLTNAPQIA